MRSDGKELEIQVKNLFKKTFEEIGYYVHKARIQKAGTQDGFDNEFKIIDEFHRTFNIFIECKDYTSKLSYSEAISKIPQIISSYKPDLMLFLSPKKPFGNPFNDSRLEQFYKHFDTHIEFLTPDNEIEKLIALDEKLYYNIYNQKVPFKVNRKQILDDFKRFLFATKPLKKVVIIESDKEKYITNIEKTAFYISRNLYPPEDSENIKQKQYYFKSSNVELNKLVFDLTKFESKKTKEQVSGLVLLGNPGMGKSVELKQIATTYWKNRDDLKWIPFYRNVSNFTSDCKLEEHLPTDWKNIPQLLIILDGLDEVSFAQKFRTKLEKFILENKSINQNIKFIISCRSNIFQNTIKSIENFKCYMLDTIKFSDAFKYLENKFELNSNDYSNLIFNKAQKEFLETPYFLNIFGNYYSKNNTLPLNKSDLLEKYLQKRLNDDNTRLKDTTFDKSIVLNSCKKIALILEAMQENEIKDNYLNVILEKNKQDFINSCFIQKVFNSDNWEFEHRSLQEFLVAKTLSNLTFTEIKAFICVDNKTNKTHPSWFNSISYLINLLDNTSNLYNEIIDWLIDNDYEIILKADSDKINDSIRINVFQKFFKKRCIKDNLWLSTYSAESKEIANFAYCIENIKFLIEQAKNIKNHRRTRISAINLLSNMELQHKIDEVKSLMIEILLEPLEIVDSRFKSDIIDAIKKLNFHKNENYINLVIKSLGNNDYHFVTTATLKLIEDSNPDNFFSYLKDLTPKILDDSKRNLPKKDNFSTSTEEDTFKAILANFNSSKHLIYSLQIFLELQYQYKFDITEKDIEGIIKKLNSLQEKDASVYIQMLRFILNSFGKKRLSYANEKIVLIFFHYCDKENEAFKAIISYKTTSPTESSFGAKRNFLSQLATVKNIHLVLEEFNSGNIDTKEVLYFRNNLSHDNFELAIKFQELIINETHYSFNDDFLDYDKRNDWTEFHETKKEESFGLLFNKNIIIDKVKDYFELIDKGIVNWDNKVEYRKTYYNSLELQKKFPDSFINLIHHTLSKNNGNANSGDVITIINSELYIINKIYQKLKSDKNNSIKLTEGQIKYITDWCLNNINKVTFYGYENKNDNNRTKCELLWFFRIYLDLNYSESNLLEMLFIDGEMYTNDKGIGYGYIIKKVEKDKINERIITNLKDKSLTPLIFRNHAIYALNNKISEVNTLIKDFIKTKKDYNWYYRKEVLYSYFEKTDDVNLLKELFKPHKTAEHSDDLTWIAIQLLVKAKQFNFVSSSLIKLHKENTLKKRELTIIQYIIISNHKDAFKILYNWIIKNITEYKNEVNYGFSSSDWKSHNNKDSIPYLIDLIKLSVSNKYNFRETTSPERIGIDVLNNICKTSNTETCQLILQKLIECKKLFEKNNTELFYLNTMINDVKEILVKHKSKPMQFAEIANKIDANKYLII